MYDLFSFIDEDYDRLNPQEARLKRLDALINEDIATYKPQPPPKKKSFARQLLDPIYSLSSGMYGGGAKVLDTLSWLGRGLSGGMAGEQLTDLPVPWLREKERVMEEAGYPKGSIPQQVYKGLGEAAIDIAALKGLGAAGIPGSAALPLYGAAQGGQQGGWYGAFTGGLTGGLTGGILHGVGELPTGWRAPAGFGAGFVTTPGSLEEKISGGAVLGGLSLGGRPVSNREFWDRYAREPKPLTDTEKQILANVKENLDYILGKKNITEFPPQEPIDWTKESKSEPHQMTFGEFTTKFPISVTTSEDLILKEPTGGAEHAGSEWSPEALARAKNNTYWAFDVKTRKIRPMIGIDAVDSPARANEIKILRNGISNKFTIQDKGEGAKDFIPDLDQIANGVDRALVSGAEAAPRVIKTALEKRVNKIGVKWEDKIYSAKAGENGIYNHSDLIQTHNIPYDEAITGFVTPEGKFVYQYPDYAHRVEVETAIRKGKPVPPEVLAEYPDLVQKVPLGKYEERVRSMLGDREVRTLLRRKLPEVIEVLGAELFDRNLPVTNFVKKVNELGDVWARNQGKNYAGLPDKDNPALGIALYPGRGGIVEYAQNALQDLLQPVRRMQKELEQYATSARAYERAFRGIHNPPETRAVVQPDGSIKIQQVGLTGIQAKLAQVQQEKRLGPDTVKTMKATLNDFYKWGDDFILAPLYEAGVISKKAYHAIKAKNQYWLPFESLKYIDPTDVDRLPIGSEIFNVAGQNLVKPMTGAAGKILPPFDSVVERLSSAVSLAEKNRILRNLILLRSRSPEVKKLIIPIKSNEKIQDISHFEDIKVILNGKVTRWLVPKDLGLSLKSLTPQSADIFARFFKSSASFFRGATTGWYLPFSIGNAPRDAKMAFIANQYGFSPYRWALGFWNGLRSSFGFPTDLFKSYLISKAGFGGLIQRQPKKAVGRLFEPPAADIARQGAMFIKNIAQAVELAPRIGLFQKAMTSGITPERSALASRRGTIDFSRAGHLMKVINQYIPFVNARLQARVTYLERFADPKTRNWAVGKALLLSVIPSVTAYLYNTLHHPDIYKEIPDYVKDNYDIVILGEDTDENGMRRPKYAKLAKGDIEQIITNPIINLLEYARQRTPKTFESMAVTWLSDVSPLNFAREGKLSATAMVSSAFPPITRGPVEAIADLNFFTGKPIIPRELREVNPTEQYTEKTPGVYKFAGQQLGISPIKLQHAARSTLGSVFYTPTPGGLAEAMGGRVIGKVGGESLNKAYRLSDQAMKGYNTARMKAEKLIKSGNEMQAQRITDEWNKSILTILMDMRKYTKQSFSELLDSPFYKQYSFQPGDWKRLLESSQEQEMTGLEKRLKYKFYK